MRRYLGRTGGSAACVSDTRPCLYPAVGVVGGRPCGVFMGVLVPTDKEKLDAARQHYAAVLTSSGGEERLVSGSDDFTMFLWNPSKSNKPIGTTDDEHIALLKLGLFPMFLVPCLRIMC